MCITLAACGGNGDNRAMDTSVAGGDVAAAPVDSTAMPSGDTGMTMAGSMTPANIMAQMTTANTLEIQQGQLARDRATNAQVKEFARMMVTDHTRLNEKGAQLASKLDITTNPGDKAEDMNEDARDAAGDLKDAKGSDFDKKYIDLQVDEHQKTLDMLNNAKGATTNQDLLAAINGAIPLVQRHLDRAKQLQQMLDK
jgi:putative membrane protein